MSGFNRPSGSKALRTARNWDRECGIKLHTHAVNFLHTHTVFTRDGAADSDTQVENLGAEFLGPSEFIRLVGVIQNQRMQIAVTGMENIGDPQLVLFG